MQCANENEIPKLALGDRRRNPRLRPRFCDTETRPHSANAAYSRAFRSKHKSHAATMTCWLGRKDSNLGIAGVAHMLTATTTADSQAHYTLAPDLVAAPRQNNRHLPRPALLFIHEVPSAVAVSSSLMNTNCRTRFAAASGSSQRGSSSSKASMLL
jgi:hypothetical protein